MSGTKTDSRVAAEVAGARLADAMLVLLAGLVSGVVAADV